MKQYARKPLLRIPDTLTKKINKKVPFIPAYHEPPGKPPAMHRAAPNNEKGLSHNLSRPSMPCLKFTGEKLLCNF